MKYWQPARKLVRDSTYGTDTRDLRFRAICKFKRSSGTSGSIKLRLYVRGEADGEEFSSLPLTSGSDQTVDVEVTGAPVGATENDEYRTIVFDFALTASNLDPDIAGIRFRLERVTPSGFTNKTVDDAVDASTTEQAFCVSTVCLSEANLNVTKDQAKGVPKLPRLKSLFASLLKAWLSYLLTALLHHPDLLSVSCICPLINFLNFAFLNGHFLNHF